MQYAIFQVGSKQYRAEKGAVIDIELMAEKKPGDEVTFEEVLVGRDGETLKVGQPVVSGAKVLARVEKNGRADKVIAFQYRRREGYHRKRGHRQSYTRIQVLDIQLG